jgi:acyl-coenzyme A synthetase/AMP-(fatty) acid ligase
MSAKEKPLDKMTVKELRDLAKGMGAEGVSGMKKEELLDFIRQAKPAKLVTEEAPPAAGKAVKKAKKKELNVKQLKQRIIVIKAKRTEALEKGDKRMATIYKRQISRLKKQTRKAAQLAAASGG